MSKRHLVLGIGELLWDFLPSGPMLGGAPANFAYMAGCMGNHAAILSRIGRDELGREAIGVLDPMPVDTSAIQVDAGRDTGRVTVSFADAEPVYTIHEPAAWDFMELDDDWLRLAERADAICFGSLAQRNAQSRQTIQTLVGNARENSIRVFDVNLRAPFYSAETIEESLGLATVVKMNEDEVPVAMRLLGVEAGPDSMLGCAQELLGIFDSLGMAAITRGARGSLLATRDAWHEHPGFAVEVADSVGAGDAFTAALTHGMLAGGDLAALNEMGNRWGSWVASQAGAMPAVTDAVREGMERGFPGPQMRGTGGTRWS